VGRLNRAWHSGSAGLEPRAENGLRMNPQPGIGNALKRVRALGDAAAEDVDRAG